MHTIINFIYNDKNFKGTRVNGDTEATKRYIWKIIDSDHDKYYDLFSGVVNLLSNKDILDELSKTSQPRRLLISELEHLRFFYSTSKADENDLNQDSSKIDTLKSTDDEASIASV